MASPIQPAPTVKQNMAQSGAEIRAFVASLKGKTPAEAMGVVARSGLARGLLLSLLIQIGLLAALTLPYAFRSQEAPPAAAAAAASSEPASIAPASVEQPVAPATVPAQPDRAEASDAPPTATPPARTVKPVTSDVDDLDAADAIDRAVEN